ncbi:hypothetical protein [Chitinophaga sp. Cy-1792]|uniref:hypothetical protein n=1 Tax=Chitinophaga sp. Cy-1792 TaxID=2608339 RepID=UPI0014224109|nr:hypothetical protein [Chitinophaga sp. Cy-1792]NIG54964.1 hypothetical protein [Chitinophaga sp. Cy-1792]
MDSQDHIADNPQIAHFFAGKPDITRDLFNFFISRYLQLGHICLVPTKTMIAVTAGTADSRRIAWVTQFGKNFIHVVFPFREEYADNLCFTKVGKVPGSATQYNHHFRMCFTDDVNDEVESYMKKALLEG